MLSASPTVSVIIPHYRDLDALRRCLGALGRQTYANGTFEIVVADNNSPEGSAAVAEAIADRARLVIVVEKGAGPARNGGVSVGNGEVLAFIDSDCVPEPQWIEEGVRSLRDYDFVGGRVVVMVDDADKMTEAEAFERVFAFDFETYITKKGFTGAGNMFCSRKVFDDVGGFRASVSEDLEWSHRARSRGYKLGYAPLAVVGHPARHSWDQLATKWRRVNAETYALYLEKRFGRLRWLLRNLALPASVIAHFPKILMSDQLNSHSQRAKAVATLIKLRFWRLSHAMALLISRGD